MKMIPVISSALLILCLSACGAKKSSDSGPNSGSLPAAPSNFSALAAARSLVLSWDSVAGAASYNAYCSSTSPLVVSASNRIANVSSPYALTGLTPGSPRYCAVTSVSNGAESALSNAVSRSALLVFTAGQAATTVIGQSNFTSSTRATSASALDRPWGSASVSESGKLFVNDYQNSRILGFNAIPTSNGAAADFAIGQADLNSAVIGTTATTLQNPYDTSNENGILAVSDNSNNRVLIYNTLPTANQAAASVVIGQANFTASGTACSAQGLSAPSGAFLKKGKLYVTDTGNHRVLIWNQIPTQNGQAADAVLGQANFTTCNANSGGISASSLNAPSNLWTDGVRLLIADANNNRILFWQTFPANNGIPADFVLGQANFTSNAFSVTNHTLDLGYGMVWSNGAQIFLADYNNSRVLIWNDFPNQNGAPADQVIGQFNFTNNATATTAAGLYYPVGISTYQDKLLVTDYFNSRVLVYASQ